MKYLLTIDFDIIMFPNIWNYDNDIYNIGEGHGVELLEDDYPEIASTIANLNNYKRITSYILYLCKHGYADRIHFIEDHKDVLKYVDKEYEWECENIDSHSDVRSGDFDIEEIPNRLNAGNWVYYFFKEFNLKKYTYIRGGDEEKENYWVDSSYLSDYDMYIQGLDTYNFDTKRIPDVVVLCASYPWVTTQFWPLFEVWKDIVNNYKVE